LPEKTLLIVDDEEAILKQLEWAFKSDFSVITAQTESDALDALKQHGPELMILDLSLTGTRENLEGFQVLESALKESPLLKIIVITGHDDRENALKAIESGAYDFYAKPVAVDELRVILHRAAYLHSLEDEIRRLRKQDSEKGEFEGIIGKSKPMQEVFETIKRVAPTDISVLITGESGTGKELVAKAIHHQSPRNEGPFIAINCGAIPDNLLESELFGHEKGSFTGAHESRPGKFEIADGGTIFLDEIGELPPALQVKILRFLQDQVIERIGGREPIQVNARIIAATNRNIEEMIEERRFREDLFYRINTVSIFLPSLRDRDEDILFLAMHFLYLYNREFSKTIRGFSLHAQKAMHMYAWPGNVRELENKVKRAVVMATGNIIQPTDLDLLYAKKTIKEARNDVEMEVIKNSLFRARGNVTTAAKELDVSRPTLHDLMKKHGISPGDYKKRKKK
jgi:two-component system NtrC family response regulator